MALIQAGVVPDIVLLGIVLPGAPGKDGVGVLGLIRADGYLVKPFQWEALCGCIKHVGNDESGVQPGPARAILAFDQFDLVPVRIGQECNDRAAALDRARLARDIAAIGPGQVACGHDIVG